MIEKENAQLEKHEPMFAKGGLEPRFMFVMRTDKGGKFATEMRQEMIEDLSKSLPFVPRKVLEARVDMELAAHKCDHEYHSIVVAEDVQVGEYSLYLADGHYDTSDKVLRQQSFKANSEGMKEASQEKEVYIGNAKLNAMRVQFEPSWHGERQEPVQLDLEDYDEFVAALETNKELKTAFMSLWPRTQLKMTLSAAVPSVKVDNRETLVKRFGEKAVQETEARIKAKREGKHG